MSDQPTNPLRFFVSYSHNDEPYKDDLTKHLASLIRSGAIASWDDRQIPIGGEWDHQIKSEMNNADVILLLISADFLNSSYCNDIEVTKAMERHNDPNDSATVVPIILRHCDWTDTGFAKLQALPKNAKPVASFNDKDEAYLYIVKQIKNLINARKNPQPAPNQTPPANVNPPTEQPLAQTPVAPAPTTDNLDDVRLLIASNKTEKALEIMMKIAKEKDEDLYNTLIIQFSRLNRLTNDINMGIASPDIANRTKNQINNSLLSMLGSF